ncbi:hypothetical protein CRG98_011534 [Punica granatum]|uniref:Uncharacterized protein n=1 Tax=Punica granatum TaxID=22663 RepID=A0A2I0KHH2_PUNGR|nr:hypothetical protein CRG98_011534 [Punica granatum]
MNTATQTTDVTLLVETPSRKSFRHKLDALYEVSYLNEDDKISATDLPLINPYIALFKSTVFSPTISIQHLIRQSPHRVEECVQLTRKGLPVVARMTLLDGRLLEYQHAWSEEALMILVDFMNTPTCVYVPHQISRDDLVKLLLDNWVTNYERLHHNAQPIQSSKPKFGRKADGKVVITFDHKYIQSPESSNPHMF